MATESILRPGELKEILLREIASADLATEDVSEVGTVLEVRDGVARIYGLKSAIASEMLEFTAQETGDTVAGLVLNLEEDNVGAAVMGDYLKLKEGDEVRRTGRLLDVPVGPAMLGRVVNALGQPNPLSQNLVNFQVVSTAGIPEINCASDALVLSVAEQAAVESAVEGWREYPWRAPTA